MRILFRVQAGIRTWFGSRQAGANNGLTARNFKIKKFALGSRGSSSRKGPQVDGVVDGHPCHVCLREQSHKCGDLGLRKLVLQECGKWNRLGMHPVSISKVQVIWRCIWLRCRGRQRGSRENTAVKVSVWTGFILTKHL